MNVAYLTPKQLADRYGVTLQTIKKWRRRTRRGDPFGPPWVDKKTFFDPTAVRIKYRLADVLAWEVSTGVSPVSLPNKNNPNG